MPLLIQATASNDVALLGSTLKTLEMLITEAPHVVSEHLNSFIPQLLRLSSFQPSIVRL
jgi:lipid A disaccharide synthetase